MEKLLPLVDNLHIEDLNNPMHPSIFDENEAYNMLILRLPVIEQTMQFRSVGFIITEQESFLYDQNARHFAMLQGRFDGPHRIIDGLADRLLKAFKAYLERIDAIEEALYEDSVQSRFMSEWLGLKRDILRIERVLIHSAETLKQMIAFYEPDDTFPINAYTDLHEHLERTQRSAIHQLAKLDYLYNFYNARTNEKMNRLIYLLTILSTIFLPLNLMVGFFGMNTSGLPFAGGTAGTLDVALIMALLLLGLSAGILWLRKHRR